jgi:hypothetical protein
MGSRSLGSLWTPTTHVLEPPPPVFLKIFTLLFFYVSLPSVSAGIRTLAKPPKNPHPGIILTTCGYQNIKYAVLIYNHVSPFF